MGKASSKKLLILSIGFLVLFSFLPANAATFPAVRTLTVTSSNSSQPTLNAEINPNGMKTTYYFEYGQTDSYGFVTQNMDAGSGTEFVRVMANMTAIEKNTTYHYRIVSLNSAGKTFGQDKSFTTEAFQNTLRVPSQEYPTIEEAINSASSGDTVLVSDGIYTGAGNTGIFVNIKVSPITIKSENGPNNCIIDCENKAEGFYFATETPSFYLEFSGFTLKNAKVQNRSAAFDTLSFYGTIKISNCFIKDNTSTTSGAGGIAVGGYLRNPKHTIIYSIIDNNVSDNSGGGILTHSGAEIIRSDITNNRSGNGGGIYGYGCKILDCNLKNNFSYGQGGGLRIANSNLDSTIINCIIENNTANTGGGVWLGPGATITNCTILNNSIHGIYYHEPSVRNRIFNSIVYGNEPNQIYPSEGAYIQYSDIENSYPGNGNIDSDPLFTGVNDYHLTANSLCINAGSIIAPELPSEDKDGNSRVIDDTPDMGAYEYPMLAPSVSTESASSINASAATLEGTVNSKGAMTTYCFEYGTTTSYGLTTAHINAGTSKSSISTKYSISRLTPNTTYYYRIIARNSVWTTYGTGLSFKTPYASTLYVAQNGDCGIRSPCYDSIQDAIDDATTGSVILVKNGSYAESLRLESQKILNIKGGYNLSYDHQSANTTFIQAASGVTNIKASSGSIKFQMISFR